MTGHPHVELLSPQIPVGGRKKSEHATASVMHVQVLVLGTGLSPLEWQRQCEMLLSQCKHAVLALRSLDLMITIESRSRLWFLFFVAVPVLSSSSAK